MFPGRPHLFLPKPEGSQDRPWSHRELSEAEALLQKRILGSSYSGEKTFNKVDHLRARPSSFEDLIKEMEAGFCHADPIILVPGPHISARKGLHLPDNEEIIYS